MLASNYIREKNGKKFIKISKSEREGFYKILFSRRDVRSHFTDKKDIAISTLFKILDAAHHAPSVGFSQPWNFIVIKDIQTREKIRNSFLKEYKKSVEMLETDKKRKKKYQSLKLEGILESNINICITYDSTRFGPFIIGTTSIPDTGIYSVCCAIQNLWLAARAEEVGVGWVSILSNKDLKKILLIPKHIKPIAYLCLGYVSEFIDKPDLERSKWLQRMNLKDLVFLEKWGNDLISQEKRSKVSEK